MPSISPAAFSYTGGALRTSRLVPARLRFTGGTVAASSDTPTTTAAEIPKLATLKRQNVYFNASGNPTAQMQLHWQRTIEAIVSAFEAVNARVDEVAILARLSAVEAKADAANDNAIAAQVTATAASTAVQETFTEIDPVYGAVYLDRLDAGIGTI